MSGLEIGRKIVGELSKNFDEVAVLVTNAERVMIKIWNSEPSVVQSWFDWDLGVRLSKSGRVWVLWYRSRDPENLIKSAHNLLNYVDRVQESEIYAPLPEEATCRPLENAYDVNVDKYMNDPSPLAELVINAALSHQVDRVAGMLMLGKTTRTLVTSKGYECVESKTSVEAYARAFKDEHSGQWAYGSTRVDANAIKTVGLKAGYYATITKTRVELVPGTYRVVISPLVVGNLFNYIVRMASALSIIAGFSFFLKYMPGSKVAADWLSVYDKPRDALLHGASGFDDEGVATYDKPIIENGVFKTMLHNSGTAKRLGTTSTGNAGWIFPVPWNVEISPGNLKEEELLQELENGVFITNNWYTRLQNYYEGIFSTVSRDATLLVQRGEIVGHVGRVRIASSFPHILANAVEATKTRYDISWWEVSIPTRAPYILLKNVQITKPEA